MEKTVSTKTLNVSGNEIRFDTVVSSDENPDGKGYSLENVVIPDDVAISLFNNLSEAERNKVINGEKFTVTISVIETIIDMEDETDRSLVERKLKEAISRDRRKTVIHGWTRLGIMEMTRKRV